jgi:hypothetical protein
LSSFDVSFSGNVVDPNLLNQSQISPQVGAVPGEGLDLLATFSDVNNFVSEYQFDMGNLVLFSDSDLKKLVASFEPDETKSIVLFNRLQKLRKNPSAVPPPSPPPNDATSTSSKPSNFGPALFPSGSSKCRDVNKWPLVLGRNFLGEADPCSVSKFCTLLISYGIKESATCIEFFRYVLFNLSSELNVEVVNYLMSKNAIEDTQDSLRLSLVYGYLKSKFAITDNPNILFANLESTRQGSRQISEFSAEFRARVEELKVVHGGGLSEAYILSIFKRCLHDSYRRCADENVHVSTLSGMIETLMLWERNFQLREGYLPNSRPQKLKAVSAQCLPCAFCGKNAHSEEKCWLKYPSLKPLKCEKCGRFHNGKCRLSKSSIIAPDQADSTKVVKTSLVLTDLNTVSCNLKFYKPWVVELKKYAVSPMVDSGATCSMVSPSFANEIVNKFKETTDIVDLPNPLPVEFGNSKKINATQTIILRDAINGKPIEFLVVPSLSIPILLGETEIIEHNLIPSYPVKMDHVAPTINTSTSDSSSLGLQFFKNAEGGITVTSPVFENSNILPWREKPHQHSELELRIMDDLITDMISKDQIRKAAPNELLIVQNLLLVDKFVTKGIYKAKTHPPEEGRYRLVLDSRPANALRFDPSTNNWIVNSMLFGSHQQTQTNEIRQSQRSALGKVETIPCSDRKYFAKIDLKSSYYSVKITNKLSQLFGFCHRGHYYVFTVLPMGWFLSSVLFQDIVSFVISGCSDKLPAGVKVVHQIDDILITGPELNDVKTAMDLIVKTFVDFGFVVRREKCEGPADNCTFCGLKLSGDGAVKPWPVKRQLNEVASQTAADLFSKAKTTAEVQHILRSWLGTANYFSKWLPPDLRAESLTLHSLLPKLDSGETTRTEVVEQSISFVRRLCEWWLSNSFGIFGGSSNDESTLVVVDANVTGWSGCIFRLVPVTENPSPPLPFSLSGLLSNHEKELISPSKSIEDYTLVPVRFDGARWNSIFETAQSSTWRERAAAMLIVHKNREVLTSKVVILSDNKNLCGSWKDTESLTSRLCSAYITYISHVSGAIHAKRSHPVLAWVDNSARGIAISALPAKRLTAPDFDTSKKVRVSTDDGDQDFENVDNDESMSDESRSISEDDRDVMSDSENQILSTDRKLCFADLLANGWIVHEGNFHYTTEKFPGHVKPHSLLVPIEESFKLLKTIHENYGHPTLTGLRKILTLWRLWAVDFNKTAKAVIADCGSCLFCRDTYHPERSSIPLPKNPMELVMADFLEPERSQPGLLVFRDRFSGYTEGRAMERLDSLEVKQLLTEWVARFGPPQTFMTDNAEAFSAELMRNFYAKYNISHRKSPVYEPQSNGAVERVIKTIEEGLRMELNCGIPIQEAIHVVCGRINRTTNVPGDPQALSPHSIIFGFTEQRPFYRDPKPVVDYKHDLSIGQKVLIKIPNASKLGLQYEDKHFFVNQVVGNHVYSLRDAAGNVLHTLHRRERLKPVTFELPEDNPPLTGGLS